MPIGRPFRGAALAVCLAVSLAAGTAACSGDTETPTPAASVPTGSGGPSPTGTGPSATSTAGTVPGDTTPNGAGGGPAAPAGGGSGAGSAAPGSPTTTPSSRNGPTATGEPAGCEAASPLLLADIGTGLVTDGVRLTNGFAVQTRAPSEEAPATWFVGARIEGPGVEAGAIGVWVTTDPSGEAGLAYAVDDWAMAVTDWRPATEADPGWTTDAPGATNVRACVTR